MRFLIVTVSLVVLLGLPATADVKVEYEDGADFSGFKTYAWHEGTEAARPQVQRWIVQAVERELKALGLRKVKDRRADVYVATHAVAQLSGATRANYINSVVYDVGILTSDIRLETKGTLAVDLVDGKSNTLVWRGLASEVMADPKPAKIRKKVDKVTRKMFKDYPTAK